MTDDISSYYDTEMIARSVDEGLHREVVGGMWDEIGVLQLNVMRAQCMRPEHKLLDIGCGSLRGGIHFVPYLDAGNYFGIDMNDSLLDAGYENELDDANQKKLPRKNLICDGNFNFDLFGEKFDYAIALSLFTHLPLNNIGVCLERLVDVMMPGGRLLASFFEIPADAQVLDDHIHQPGNITTHAKSDPYHYRLSDIFDLAATLPFRPVYIGDVGHPRAQQLIAFIRD